MAEAGVDGGAVMAVVEAPTIEAELGIARIMVVAIDSVAAVNWAASAANWSSCRVVTLSDRRSTASIWGMVTPARMLTSSFLRKAFCIAGGLRQAARSFGWQARRMLSAD